ncbi:hypothetical protein Pla163_34750 [Planctomycetes bacterium Pla163]|uniref:Uncharacterized protein n=1 Tax=Rohdeia mirabilis TaxID=2528008 RepID=A0A518D4D6_9BACT|nr:hypothetical protein Pla163_34750 [Planctomycetes bacterium Pla163]
MLDLEGARSLRCVARADPRGSALLVVHAGADRSLRLDLRGQRGRPAFELRVGSETVRLAGREPVDADNWIVFVVNCEDGAIELLVDGEVVDGADANLEPAALFGGAFEDEVEVLLGGNRGAPARPEAAVDELRIERVATRSSSRSGRSGSPW